MISRSALPSRCSCLSPRSVLVGGALWRLAQLDVLLQQQQTNISTESIFQKEIRTREPKHNKRDRKVRNNEQLIRVANPVINQVTEN